MLAVFGTPSGGELLLVLLVVLLLFGAKNLPRMARTLGRTLEEFRRAAKEVTDEIVHADDSQPLQRPRPLIKASAELDSDNREEAKEEFGSSSVSKSDTRSESESRDTT